MSDNKESRTEPAVIVVFENREVKGYFSGVEWDKTEVGKPVYHVTTNLNDAVKFYNKKSGNTHADLAAIKNGMTRKGFEVNDIYLNIMADYEMEKLLPKKTYADIRKETETARNALIEKSDLFFAFSNEQFEEGMSKTTLAEGDEIVRFWGGFIPKSQRPALIAGFEEISKAEHEQIKKFKLEEDEVLYELANHEAFYVGSIEDTLRALNGHYTREFVTQVYRKHQASYFDDWIN